MQSSIGSFLDRSLPPQRTRLLDNHTGASSSAVLSSRYKDRDMADKRHPKLSWFAGMTRRDRGNEHRKPKGSGKSRDKQNQRPAQESVDSMDRASAEPELIESEELESSSSKSSGSSSDEFPSKVRALASRTSSQGDRRFLEKVGQHIHDQDREMRKMVTLIAKMHEADKQKRDDRYFVKETKTLRVVIENWSKTQTVFRPSSIADARVSSQKTHYPRNLPRCYTPLEQTSSSILRRQEASRGYYRPSYGLS